MTSSKIAFLTVAAVVSTFASNIQAQTRPVFATNGSGRNSNWSSSNINTSFYPNSSGNPFRRVMIAGDSVFQRTNSSNYIRFRPRVFIIRAGDTVTLTGDVDVNSATSGITPGGIDTLYIYGVLNFGTSGSSNDLQMFSYVSGTENNSGRSGMDYGNTSTTNRTGVVNLMSGGRIIGGGSSSNFQWANGSGTFSTADINGSYNQTGPKRAVRVTSSNTNANSRFQNATFTFLPLPVDLASFNVNTTDNGHEISWTAVGESNRNNFILEISSNGRDFTQVAELAGNPEASKQNYTYLLNRQDRAFFVRLSETNTTGYTNVLATKYVILNNAAIASCSVYPTVVSSNESVNLVFSEVNTYQVQVINQNGQRFINSNIETATENEVSSLDLNQLPAGQYLVKIYSASGFAKTEKIIITE